MALPVRGQGSDPAFEKATGRPLELRVIVTVNPSPAGSIRSA